MAEAFLRLPLAEQAEILNGLAPELGRAAVVLEKDVWVCWVLQHLFQMPGRLPMAFKGGTSLSKVFDAISRFSEDVDVTLDYRGFDTDIDPFDANTSKSQIKKLGESLKGFVRDHAHEVATPYFTEQLREQFDPQHARVEVSDNGEEFRIYYPSALDQAAGYVGNSVLIEFGGRNITEPNAEYQVRPYIADRLPSLDLPSATVTVLSPARTFWEKVTLIHVECHRPDLKADANRQSRHWYDLALLADHDIGRQALADRALLADVVKHKKVFFGAGYANYDACQTGGIRLLPDQRLLDAVASDLRAMIDAGMFYGERPSFEKIIGRLRALEHEINAGARLGASD
ncbi:MAG: uncharacterized protein JWQ90_3127 [Hydrocarboniphaga sp.]|uniref:nucleotidyl transferase AbiEii/AbiGii toxin family protein n=1 Tax=Hydrocarboniphaga sp. TaxID=2033016 RepID=UPI00261DEB14|nr:nucleotidyl transferase AbiEii/AbiGii toxin family protein [Hydrocarboniphaga sp.]MDB5970677.1 uncharacterized protein [Hydrocarboniphaga sp.]